jgi:hypothetical protein
MDPFGVSPDGERRWLRAAVRRELGEDEPLIGRLLLSQPAPVVVSHGHYESGDAETCGRWVVVRLWHRNLSDAQFARLVRSEPGVSPDEYVVRATQPILGR